MKAFLASSLLLTLACVDPLSEGCERTLSCADEATLRPTSACEWFRADGGAWVEAPQWNDAGWTWFEESVNLQERCPPANPAPPPPDQVEPEEEEEEEEEAEAAAREEAPAEEVVDVPEPTAPVEEPSPDPPAAPPTPEPVDAGAPDPLDAG